MINVIRSIYSTPALDIDVKTCGKRTKYSDLEVKQAMALYKKVNCYGEVERQLGISRNTIRLWVSKYLKYYNIPKKKLTTGAHKIKPMKRQAMLVKLVTGMRMTPAEISKGLNISVITVRRDILELLSEGRIVDIMNCRLRLITAA